VSRVRTFWDIEPDGNLKPAEAAKNGLNVRPHPGPLLLAAQALAQRAGEGESSSVVRWCERFRFWCGSLNQQSKRDDGNGARIAERGNPCGIE